MKKRIPALLLSGVLSLSLLSTSAFALELGKVDSTNVKENPRLVIYDTEGKDQVITTLKLVDGKLSTGDEEIIQGYLEDKAVTKVELETPDGGFVEITNPTAETYTVTFSSNGGSGTMDSVEVTKVKDGATTYTLPACGFTAPEGKEFAGWSVNGETKQPGDTITLTGNITITATWTDKDPAGDTYTIKFNSNGGTGDMPDKTVKKSESGETTFNIPANAFTAPSGKEFDRWTVSGEGLEINNGVLLIAGTVPTSREITLTATWKNQSTTPVNPDPGNQGGNSGSSSSGTSGSSSPAIKPLPDRNPGTTTPANPGTTTPTPEFFTDVPATHWAAGAISWVSANGYMRGMSNNTFNPDGLISRQQMWMILARIAGSDPANMAAARTWAMGRNLTDGTGPALNMSRQQLVTFLYRFAQRQGFTISGSSPLTTFPDNANVADYAQAPMSWAVANGLVAGKSDGRLDPTGTATRAQFATILQRFFTNIVNKNA